MYRIQTPQDTTITMYQITEFDENKNFPDAMRQMRVFADKNEFVAYIASKIQTDGYHDPERWYCPFLYSVNNSYTDKDVSPMPGATNMPSILKPYVFLDAFDNLVNPRDYWGDVIRYVHYKMAYPVNPAKQRRRNDAKFKAHYEEYRRQRPNRKFHSYTRYRNHVRRPAVIANSDPEYKTFRKAKYDYPKSWFDEPFCHRSSGWKSNKMRHPWQKHKLYKGRIMDKASRNELNEQAYLRSIGIDYNDIENE